jgi:hypothetical protein
VSEKLVPIHKVDRAVRRIERWGTAEEKAQMGKAISLPDQHEARPAIIAVAERVMERRAMQRGGG